MVVANFLVLPAFYGIPSEAAVGLLLPIALFNAMQGGISVVGGWTLYQAVLWRMPSLARLRDA